MSLHYKKYIWKEGIPIGMGSLDPADTPESFKVISDPYRKRISIEKYHYNHFEKIIYDSALLNFKDLKKPEQIAWEKLIIKDENGISRGYLRNQDDRLICIETYEFHDNLCRSCYVHSPHGLLLSTHKMYYKNLEDFMDGVILFDSNDSPVMLKRYIFDDISHQFTDLIEEQWDMEKLSLPLNLLK